MINKFKLSIVLVIVLFFTFYFTPQVNAANIFIESPLSVGLNKTFGVSLFLDADNQPINSVDVILTFDNDVLLFSGYKTNDGFIQMWIDPPSAKNNEINFSGIIPGGVSGVFDPKKSTMSPIPLVTLLFKAKKNGVSNFLFTKSSILKNDGIGTELFHEKKGDRIEVSNLVDKSEFEEKLYFDLKTEEKQKDTEQPLPFDIFFIKSSLFSKTPSMIAFSAIDEDSGVEKYEIKVNNMDWEIVKSPYPVPSGLFSKILTIRATDFYGNIRESHINTVGFIDGNLRLDIWFLLGFTLLLFVVLLYKLLRLNIPRKNG